MSLTPFVDFKERRRTPTLITGSDTRAIDPYRQGVEITGPHNHFLGIMPKAGSGTPDHQLEQTSFGQSDEFQQDVSYRDMTELYPPQNPGNPESGIMAYPLVGGNPSYQNVKSDDGAIDPLSVRHSNAYTPGVSVGNVHGVAGNLQDGNTDAVGKSDAIVDSIPFRNAGFKNTPFIDGVGEFSGYVSSSIVPPWLPGVNRATSPTGGSTGTPFDYSPTGIVENAVMSMSTNISGVHTQDSEYIGFDSVSATKGFEYQSSRRMSRRYTDSLAFGDKEHYAHRGELNRRDCVSGSYPTPLRTGDKTSNSLLPFDDRFILKFTTGTINIGRNIWQNDVFNIAPYVSSTYRRSMVEGHTYPYIGQRKFDTTSMWPIVTQSNAVTVRPGIGDECVSIDNMISGGIKPFNETAAYHNAVSSSANYGFFANMTNSGTFPGFSSPANSKIGIKIDLTPAHDTTLYRISTSRISSLSGSNTPEFLTGSTGFVYFNHVTKTWDQIGLTDPATGADYGYDYVVSVNSPTTADVVDLRGNDKFLAQFSMSPQTVALGNAGTSLVISNADARMWGYSKIGTPTNSCYAPFSTKYHAVQNQTLKMSNYIKHPFLLQGALLKINLTARRRQSIDTTGLAQDNDQRRDIDNHVFFVYRQTRNNDPRFGHDSATDISGSTRNIIMSASFCFWNLPTVQTGYIYGGGLAIPPNDTRDWPLHKPVFQYNWNAPVNSGSATHTPAQNFNQTVNVDLLIPIIPAVGNIQAAGASSFPGQENIGGTQRQRTVKFQNFWMGTTTNAPFMTKDTGCTGKNGFSSSINFYNPGISGHYIGKFGISDMANFFEISKEPFVSDERSMRPHGIPGGLSNATQTLGIYSTTGSIGSSTPAPYLLLPTDELVFGFDAGISQFMNGASLGLTGSYLTINAAESYITLYGSLVREDKEFVNTLNQNLTSDAIHEAIYSDDVLDQFEAEPREFFSGTYIDDFVRGNMSPGYVTRKKALSKVTDAGGFFRGAQSRNYSERIFDTIMPDITDYVQRIGSITSTTITDSGVSIVQLNPADYFIEKNNNRMPFPYDTETPRRDITAKISDDGSTILLVDTVAISYLAGSNLHEALFDVGQKSARDTGGVIHEHYSSGAVGYRYGIYNSYARYTNAVFRYNKYGQFRDMLEQRIDTKASLTRNAEHGTKTSLFESPVQISFVGGNPSLTDSSNLSTEATSSVPYFDGTFRNRTEFTQAIRARLSAVELL